MSEVNIEIIPLKSDLNYCKCPRCWKYHACKDNFDGLCDHCCSVLLKDYPEHESIQFIKESYNKQRMMYLKES